MRPMEIGSSRHSAFRAAAVGLIGLAAAMGIGRFAFTPMLPLMQAQNAVTLGQGSYLAGANYAGYLIGALLALALNPRPVDAARLGLAAVAVSTLAMAFTSSFPVWLGLRGMAGTASAFVLVGVSAWSLTELARHHRASWSGWVFAGVGSGMLLVGLAVLAIAAAGRTPAFGWLALGVAAALAALAAAGLMTAPAAMAMADAGGVPGAVPGGAPAAAGGGVGRSAWLLIVCYAAFGFGYIIPATFLPAAARILVEDPAVFGWAWPVFGLAAAASTIFAAMALRHLGPRRIWGLAQMGMAVGIALPAIEMSLTFLLISALVVGGTFMVVTMAGLQEGRRVGGTAAPRLMAAMTAAFATGQLLGPLTVSASRSAAEAIRTPSLIAAAVLFVTGLILLAGSRRPGSPEPVATTRARPG